MPKQRTVLVVCAHSDDQILGPGGTLAKYANEGNRIITVILSYGEAGLPLLKPKIARATRMREALEADRVIGGHGIEFIGLKEGRFLQEKDKAISRLKRLILKFKPSRIFTHHNEDLHPDHRATLKIVLECLEQLNYACHVYAFDVWNPILFFRKRHVPVMVVDISNTFKTKIKALKCFKSQRLSVFTLLLSVYLRAVIHGMKIGKRYAERFFKIR